VVVAAEAAAAAGEFPCRPHERYVITGGAPHVPAEESLKGECIHAHLGPIRQAAWSSSRKPSHPIRRVHWMIALMAADGASR
jgi:hypothetical protein